MSPSLSRRWTTSAACAAIVVLCSSCVLRESTHYTLQPAPPDGVHVTLRPQATDLLKAVSDLVTAGRPIDGALRSQGLAVRCDTRADRRPEGDRCAFDVLGATKVDGSLAGQAFARLAWNRAIARDQLSDFSRDGMIKVRANPGACLHVTIRGTTGSVNWTWRTARSTGC